MILKIVNVYMIYIQEYSECKGVKSMDYAFPVFSYIGVSKRISNFLH
jgi:hypothetical protein